MFKDGTNDGDTRTKRGQERPQSHDAGGKLLDECETTQTAMKRYVRLGGLVFWFAALDHGFLKIRRSLDSTAVHCTWTWSTGPHAGSYVYATSSYFEVDMVLEILARKLAEVEDGRSKPTRDKLGHSWTGRKI